MRHSQTNWAKSTPKNRQFSISNFRPLVTSTQPFQLSTAYRYSHRPTSLNKKNLLSSFHFQKDKFDSEKIMFTRTRRAHMAKNICTVNRAQSKDKLLMDNYKNGWQKTPWIENHQLIYNLNQYFNKGIIYEVLFCSIVEQ